MTENANNQLTSEERVARFAEEKKQAIAMQASAKHRHYAMLLVSICFEITATISLKASEGFTVLLPSISTVICYAVSFGMLVVILKHLPLGLVYGVWGGLGTVATMLAGVLIWNDPFTPLMALAVVLIVGGVYLLNKGTDELEAKRAQQD